MRHPPCIGPRLAA